MFETISRSASIFYEKALLRTVGVIRIVPRHVPNVDVFQPHISCNLAGHFQGSNRGREKTGQLVVWKEPGEVQGDIGGQVLLDPPAHLPYDPQVVVECGDDEVHLPCISCLQNMHFPSIQVDPEHHEKIRKII